MQLTQAELADRLHVTRQAVSKWESGKSVPDTGTLLTMAELFGVSVETVLSGEEAVPSVAGAKKKIAEERPRRAKSIFFARCRR